MKKIKFRLTNPNNYFAVPEPFIPNGSLLILYQNGIAEVCKYNESTETEDIYLFHPKNFRDFSDELKELIKINYPFDLDDEDSNTYTLPEEFNNRLIWD